MRSLLKEAEPDKAKVAKEVASWVYYHLEQMHLELAVRRRQRQVRFACIDSLPSAHEALTSERACKNCVPGSRGPMPIPSVKMAIWAHSLCLPIYFPASFLCRS